MKLTVKVAQITVETEIDGHKTRRVFKSPDTPKKPPKPPKTIRVPECDERIWNLPGWYFQYMGTEVVRRISLKHIVPTEPKVTTEGIRYYMGRTRLTSKDAGLLPIGLRFYGSPLVYLQDGNHRRFVAKQKGRTYMRLVVRDIDMSLEDALEAAKDHHQRERERWKLLETELA